MAHATECLRDRLTARPVGGEVRIVAGDQEAALARLDFVQRRQHALGVEHERVVGRDGAAEATLLRVVARVGDQGQGEEENCEQDLAAAGPGKEGGGHRGLRRGGRACNALRCIGCPADADHDPQRLHRRSRRRLQTQVGPRRDGGALSPPAELLRAGGMRGGPPRASRRRDRGHGAELDMRSWRRSWARRLCAAKTLGRR